MTEETCDICSSETDDYGCLGVWTGVHTARVFEMHEEAMTAAIETLEDLQRYCKSKKKSLPTRLDKQATDASTLMRTCLGIDSEEARLEWARRREGETGKYYPV